MISLFLIYPSLSRATHILYIYVFILKNHIPGGFGVKMLSDVLDGG